MEYDVEREPDRVTVRLAGEVDLETSPDLREVLVGLGAETPVLEVECSGLSFIDSTGLSALLAAHKAMEERGGRFEVKDPPAMLRKMVSIVGLADVLTLTSS